MREYINMASCPFKQGDRVKAAHTNEESTVLYVDEEHVFCITDDERRFYRTWSHELDMISRKSGGGLTKME